jgi:hypothetical protein
MAVVEKPAKGGDVVAGGGLGQRRVGTLNASARREQRGAESEQKHEPVHDGLRETSYTMNFMM